MRRFAARVGVVLLATLLACDANDPGSTSQADDGRFAFVGGRIIDGRGGAPIEDGVLLVRDGRIESVGARSEVELPSGVRQIDVSGKTLIPGLINTHGHVGGTLGLSSSSENYTEENLLRQLELYARYGVTTVFSLGGDGPQGVSLRDAQDDPSLDRARLFVAGPVVDGGTPEEARAQVQQVAELGADIVKIRVDDFLGRGSKMAPEVYRAVFDEAHARGLEVAVHLYYLEDARAVLEAGADFIVHSVRDALIDDELSELLKTESVCLSPTLTREVSTFVYEGEPEFFSDPFFTHEADPEVLAQLRDPERRRSVADNPATPIYKAALATAQSNLKTLADAGASIAFGTDSGPPARFQGYFEHLELELMAEAGLSPAQILRSATGDAAACIDRNDVGALVPGRWADLVVLDANPLDDIANTRQIDSVWIAGNRVPPRG